MTKALPKKILLAAALCATVLASAQTPIESEGLLVIEVESIDSGSRFTLESSVAGYKGTGYFRGNANMFNIGGVGKLAYPFEIANSSTYQFAFRSRIGEGTSNTDSNDTFIRLVDSEGNPVIPVANQNVTTTGSWYKVYMNHAGDWSHQASNKDNDPHSLSWVLEAGNMYALEMSVRSKNHLVDRLILWDINQYNLANKLTGKQPNEAAFDKLTVSVPPPRDNVIHFGDITVPDEIYIILDAVYEWQAARLEPHNNQSIIGWKHAAFYTGVMDLFHKAGNQKYVDLLSNISVDHNWTMLEVNQALWRHADNHLMGETYINLHIEDGEQDPVQVAHVNSIFNRMIAEPWEGRRLYKWCDALFMSPPVWAQLASLNNDDKYLQELDELWWDATDFLYNTEWNLYYRDGSYIGDVEANGNPVFWSRGNGWVIGGLVRVLNYMREDWTGRQQYIDLFVDMAKRIKDIQMASGGWASSLVYPERFGFETEVSGTSFFVYGLAWGINNGILDKAVYGPVVEKGWLEMNYNLNADGSISNIQTVGKEPQPNDDQVAKREYGYGAFILAGLEMIDYYGDEAVGEWAGFPVYDQDGQNWSDTDSFMGWLEVTASPYVYSQAVDGWIFINEEDAAQTNGSWAYFFKD